MQIPRWVSVKVRAPPVLPLAVSQDTEPCLTSLHNSLLGTFRPGAVTVTLSSTSTPRLENTRYVVCNRRQKKLREPGVEDAGALPEGSQFELCFQVQNSEFKVSRNSLPSAPVHSPHRVLWTVFKQPREQHLLHRRGPFPWKAKAAVCFHTFSFNSRCTSCNSRCTSCSSRCTSCFSCSGNKH